MPNMKEFEGKELTIRISGEVQSSNLEQFETEALAVIEAINLQLITDDDFAEAENNIKSCKYVEERIHNARQDALNSTAEISKLLTTTERLESKFRDTRLKLNKLVKDEKENRKKEIIAKAKVDLMEKVSLSPVKQFFSVNFSAIVDAIKGKRSLEKMQEAVDEVVTYETERLEFESANYLHNIKTIEESEKEYPGLFPDKVNLAQSATEIVEAQITSRIADFKYKQEMKEKAEREAKERREKEAAERAEAEKKRQEEKEAAELEKEQIEEVKEQETEVIETIEPPQHEEEIRPPVDIQPPSFKKLYTIYVEVETDEPAEVVSQIHEINGVITVDIRQA